MGRPGGARGGKCLTKPERERFLAAACTHAPEAQARPGRTLARTLRTTALGAEARELVSRAWV